MVSFAMVISISVVHSFAVCSVVVASWARLVQSPDDSVELVDLAVLAVPWTRRETKYSS